MSPKISPSMFFGHTDILGFMRSQFNQPSFSWRTVLRWKKKGMPFHRTWSGQPFIISSEIIRWQLKNK